MKTILPTNKTLQLKQNIYQNQTKSTKTAKDSRDVWQDKDAVSRVRAASSQPVMVSNALRTPYKNTKSIRVQNHSTKRKLHQVASWVDEPIMLQLNELARTQRLSMSQTIRGLLKEILRQKFYEQQAATLPELIQNAVAKSHRSMITRLAWLLVRIAFDTGQTRVISTNTLGMQEGMNEESLKEILVTADKRTKANLTRKTPQLTELMEAVEKWLLEEEGSKAN